MRRANSNMEDQDDDNDVIEFSGASDDEELDRDSTETPTGREKNLWLLENATSIVWKFFGFLAGQDGRIMEADKRKQTEVYCNRCYVCLKYTGGTINLRYHLKKHHLT